MMFKHSYGYANLETDKELVRMLGGISRMSANVQTANNKEVVLVVGSTGAGKSTFVNYITGKEMYFDEESDGVSCSNPAAKIGHGVDSCTAMPEIYQEPSTSLIFGDCPGYYDTHGVANEIGNAVGIQCLAKNSKQVKGIILVVNYSAWDNCRGQGLEDALGLLVAFLGRDPASCLDSVLLLFTKVPDKKIEKTLKTIEKETERFQFCRELIRRGNIAFYSPLNDLKPRKSVLTRSELLAKIQKFRGIANSENTFNISISDRAALEVTGMVSILLSRVRKNLEKLEFQHLPEYFQVLNSLATLNIGRVNDEIETLDTIVIDQVKLYEFHENGIAILSHLMEVMPNSYQPMIEQTLQRTQRRVEKEQHIEAERVKMQSELDQANHNMAVLHNEQSKLKKSLDVALEEGKLTKQEYEKRIREMHTEMAEAKKDRGDTVAKLRKLETELDKVTAEKDNKVNELITEIKEMKQDYDKKTAKLQEDLKEAQNRPEFPGYPGFPGFHVYPVPIMGPYPIARSIGGMGPFGSGPCRRF